jgi:hypothetical protein
MTEALKLNIQSMETDLQQSGFFYRRIGVTVYKVRVFTSEKSTDNVCDKIICLIPNQAVTGAGSCGSMDIAVICTIALKNIY